MLVSILRGKRCSSHRSACWSFVRWMTRQQESTFPTRAFVTCKEGYEADGSISTTFAQTVQSSGSQMLRCDTLIQSGIGVNWSGEGVFIGDACMVFLP